MEASAAFWKVINDLIVAQGLLNHKLMEDLGNISHTVTHWSRKGVGYLLFVQDLHGIVLAIFSVPHQHHAAKRTRAQSFQALKLLQRGCVLSGKRSVMGKCSYI